MQSELLPPKPSLGKTEELMQLNTKELIEKRTINRLM
jgi:hypothetical protein